MSQTNRHSREARLDTMTPEMKEIVAENMKERVYSTITLIAVLTVMWQNANHHSTIGVITIIFGSVVALWMATLISIRMSYRAIHGRPINMANYRKALFSASGLLAPAITPFIIIAVSGATHWYDLKSALMASMVVSLLSLFALSFNASRRIYDSIWRQLLVSLLEMSVGVGVILLKLAVGE